MHAAMIPCGQLALSPGSQARRGPISTQPSGNGIKKSSQVIPAHQPTSRGDDFSLLCLRVGGQPRACRVRKRLCERIAPALIVRYRIGAKQSRGEYRLTNSEEYSPSFERRAQKWRAGKDSNPQPPDPLRLTQGRLAGALSVVLPAHGGGLVVSESCQCAVDSRR